MGSVDRGVDEKARRMDGCLRGKVGGGWVYDRWLSR